MSWNDQNELWMELSHVSIPSWLSHSKSFFGFWISTWFICDSRVLHTYCVFVWALRAQCCVSGLSVLFFLHLPGLTHFPFLLLFVLLVGRLVCLFDLVNEFWKYLQAGSHTKASRSLRWFSCVRGWFSVGRPAFPFALVCFSKCEVTSLHSCDSQKGDWLFPFKSVFLQLVMKVHREQRVSVGVPGGWAHSSGTKIPRPGPARSTSPRGLVLSLFITKVLVWIYRDFRTARFRHCCSLQQ